MVLLREGADLICLDCEFENPDGVRFCGNCASPLQGSVSCPACRFENPPGFKFCGGCAAPLGARADEIPQPMRQVTLALIRSAEEAR